MWDFRGGCMLKKIDLIKFKMAAFSHFSLLHGRCLVNHVRWLDHYYKRKCELSGEDALWKNSTRSNSKRLLIGNYSLSHGWYSVNRARWLDHYYKTKCEISAFSHFSLSHGRCLVNHVRWLDHYYKTKCEISGEDASWKISTRSNSKWPRIGHYSFSHGRYLVNRARWLDHY